MGTKTVLTLADFERLPEDGNLHELNEGELVSVTHPKLRHGIVASKLRKTLGAYIDKLDLGEIYFEVAYLLSDDPPTLRIPDVSFCSKKRVAEADLDTWFQGAPELAVEIVSPSDSAQDLEAKVGQYLGAGARYVWVIYPVTRTVHVFDSNRAARVLSEADTLDAPDLFPGWSVKVADLLA